MSSTLKTKVPFEQLVEVKIDNRGKTPPLVATGYPLLEIKSVSSNSLYPVVEKADKFVDQETWETWFRQHLQKDDILFTTVGTIAESAIVPENPNFAVAQNILGFRFDAAQVYAPYMLYLMRSRWFINQISGRTIETVQKSIKWSDIRGIEISLPDLDVQKRVANFVLSIDQKIELNLKMNKTLEEIGQALFKHNFINGKGIRKGLLAEIVTQTSERVGGNIQADFKVLSAVKTGHLVPSEDYFTKRVYSKDIVNYKKLNKFDFAYNPARINIGSIGMLEDNLLGVVSPIYVTFRPKIGYHFYVKELLKLDSTKKRIAEQCTGSVRQSLRFEDFTRMEIGLQSEDVLETFNENYEIIYKKSLLLDRENSTLSGIRDSLLSQLLVGKISL